MTQSSKAAHLNPSFLLLPAGQGTHVVVGRSRELPLAPRMLQWAICLLPWDWKHLAMGEGCDWGLEAFQ